MKPYFKLSLPFPETEFLARGFTLPKHSVDFSNRHLPMKDTLGNYFQSHGGSNNWNYSFGEERPIAQFFSQKLLDFFNQRNLKPCSVWILYFHEHSDLGKIHVDWGWNDPARRQNNFGFNWSYADSDQHSMIWYKPSDQSLTEEGWPKNTSSHETTVITRIWEKEDVTEIARHTVTGPTLVRNNIPHNGENYGCKYRWVFSIRFNNIFESWEDCVKHFEDIIIE